MTPIVLESPAIRLAVRPDLGGKIASLLGKSSGTEWLWANPHLPARPAQYGESYVKGLDAGGWDEIFPSVLPCMLEDGTRIPDHGDVVALPATVCASGPGRLVLETRLRSLPMTFTRTMTLEENHLRLDYVIESHATIPLPFLWASHPLFQLEAGMELTGLDDVPFRVAAWLGAEAATKKGTTCPGRDIARIPDVDAPGFRPMACKLFSPAGVVDRVGLQRPNGSRVTLAWDARENPHLGIWLNLGAWSGCGSAPYFNLGLEPTTCACDSLRLAVNQHAAPLLPPHAKRSWSVTLTLDDVSFRTDR